ncbi:MAG: ATP-binding protein [Vulcanimicrobiota bacterium]
MEVLLEPPATPLEYFVVAELPEELPLDTVLVTRREVAGHGLVSFYGIVDEVEMGEYYMGRVRVLRIEPEIFVPPVPGAVVEVAEARTQEMAFRFNEMKRRMAAGRLRGGQKAFLNLDFLNGQRGAHINIAGISGVATKTSYALFLLYSLFHSAPASRAIIFNVKGDDLLYLHKPNARNNVIERSHYELLGLPYGPFPEVAYHQDSLWSLREFAENEFVRYLFNDDDQTGSQTMAVEHLAVTLKELAAASPPEQLFLDGEAVTSLMQLSQAICQSVDDAQSRWFDKAAAATRFSIVRRLHSAAVQVNELLHAGGRPSFHYRSQLNVVDLHRLGDKARAFVVGAILKTLFEARESQGDQHPTVYLVLDELNKYAPRHGSGPIKDMLLDVAERGRSLGVVLIGAEQNASQVEERILSNASIRVVGRLEAEESNREAYGWLSGQMRDRCALLQPGSMVVSQPDVPVPLMMTFPFPAWATRCSEVAEPRPKRGFKASPEPA